jgi:hypothetical protein
MPTNCAVPTCNGEGGFAFPKDDSMKLKWRVAIKREDKDKKSLWMPNTHSRVCEKHFKEDDFALPEYAKYAENFFQHRKMLKPGAVPSIFAEEKPRFSASSRSTCIIR